MTFSRIFCLVAKIANYKRKFALSGAVHTSRSRKVCWASPSYFWLSLSGRSVYLFKRHKYLKDSPFFCFQLHTNRPCCHLGFEGHAATNDSKIKGSDLSAWSNCEICNQFRVLTLFAVKIFKYMGYHASVSAGVFVLVGHFYFMLSLNNLKL